jgi:hypothetical protein
MNYRRGDCCLNHPPAHLAVSIATADQAEQEQTDSLTARPLVIPGPLIKPAENNRKMVQVFSGVLTKTNPRLLKKTQPICKYLK